MENVVGSDSVGNFSRHTGRRNDCQVWQGGVLGLVGTDDADVYRWTAFAGNDQCYAQRKRDGTDDDVPDWFYRGTCNAYGQYRSDSGDLGVSGGDMAVATKTAGECVERTQQERRIE